MHLNYYQTKMWKSNDEDQVDDAMYFLMLWNDMCDEVCNIYVGFLNLLAMAEFPSFCHFEYRPISCFQICFTVADLILQKPVFANYKLIICCVYYRLLSKSPYCALFVSVQFQISSTPAISIGVWLYWINTVLKMTKMFITLGFDIMICFCLDTSC